MCECASQHQYKENSDEDSTKDYSDDDFGLGDSARRGSSGCSGGIGCADIVQQFFAWVRVFIIGRDSGD